MAKKTKRKVAYRTLPMQRHLNLRQEGEHFDLGAIFVQLNQRYFRGRLRNYKVEWGRRRKHRPKDHFVFGTIQEEDRVIRIHPLLSANNIPTFVIESVIHHEYLHHMLGAPHNRLARLTAAGRSARETVEELYWAALTRPPTEEESNRAQALLEKSTDKRQALEDVTWALLNAKEFVLRK